MRRVFTSVILAADAASLVVLLPSVRDAVDGAEDPRDWLARAGTEGVCAALAATGLWLVAARIAVGLLATALAQAPGIAGRAGGRAAAAVSRVLLPALVRRAVAGTAGLGLVLAPVAAGAATGGTSMGGGGGPPAPRAAVVASATAGGHGVTADPLPPPVWPRTAGPQPQEVHVRPGDSLWLLAARRLGPTATDREIAAAWPRWYRHNRAVIGPDPGRLVPGQVLTPPDHTRTEDS